MSELTARENAWCDWMEKRGLRFGTVERRCETASQISFLAGANWESTRIREALIDAISAQRSEWALAKPLGEDGIKTDRDIGADAAFASVLAALDRICPEGKE